MKIRHRILTAVAPVALVALAAPALAGFSGVDVYLPSVGRKPGVPPTQWYTAMWVFNPQGAPAHVRYQFLERDKSNTAPLEATETIGAYATRAYEDAITDLFHVQAFGAVRVISDQNIVVQSRIYSQTGAVRDSVGQLFNGIPAHFAVGAGRGTELVGVFQTQPADASAFRYNFGFVETGGGTVSLLVVLTDAGGNTITVKGYTVRPYEQRQFQFRDEFPGVSTTNARLSVQVSSGTGRVIAFGSRIANGSQDPSTFEMVFPGDLLGSGSSGGLTSVAHDATLAGEGTSSAPLALANNGVTSAKIADGTIATADLANGGVTKAKLAASGGASGQVLTTDGSNLLWQTLSGGGGGGDITGVVAGTGLAGGGMFGDVTLSIATGGITSAMIADGTVAATDVAFTYAGSASKGGAASDVACTTCVGASELADNAVTKGKLAAGGGTSGQVLGTDGTNLVWQAAPAGGGLELPFQGSATSSGDAFRVTNLGTSDASIGIQGRTLGGYGVYGYGKIGVSGEGSNVGVFGQGTFGIRGQSTNGTGVRGDSVDSFGVHGVSSNGDGVFGEASASNKSGLYAVNNNPAGYAAYMRGNAHVTGTLSEAGGAFRIDHPVDPENRVLQHSFVESPDMMNIYNGNVVTDALGEAVVELPAYFEALNRDFRYQLTVIGEFAQAIVASKVADGRFVIRTDKPGIEVSWQVTGIRKDPWAEANRIVVEQDKPEAERGFYLHATAYGAPPELDVETVRHPDVRQGESAERDTVPPQVQP